MKSIKFWVIALMSFMLVACAKPANTAENTTLQPSNAKNTTKTETTTTKQPLVNQKLSSLQHTEHFLKNAIVHIFEGEINRNGQAVGYHYEGLNTSKAKIVENTRSKTDKNGVYRAKITIDGKEKNAFSSFFPNTWPIQQVVDTINEAYDNRQHQSGNIYNGTTKSGITVQMYLTDDNKIISAFPLYNR
ncbi:EndoU domain-containing protein [Carnobacteriaceae bacterium zg-ZUI252]|nr:EndoU domain-containing protein [Carnobacteriaceae bacterium zg-ZUI252]MBS4769588.1 EndoU domain-containing protein [Carnobacteriaceae bacterium zg-ZUI240]QTU83051.1 EndoU domain-containing protein [Carnobacteriaceae bacterium zg-C25]